jgi:hypothetical protein
MCHRPEERSPRTSPTRPASQQLQIQPVEAASRPRKYGNLDNVCSFGGTGLLPPTQLSRLPSAMIQLLPVPHAISCAEADKRPKAAKSQIVQHIAGRSNKPCAWPEMQHLDSTRANEPTCTGGESGSVTVSSRSIAANAAAVVTIL